MRPAGLAATCATIVAGFLILAVSAGSTPGAAPDPPDAAPSKPTAGGAPPPAAPPAEPKPPAPAAPDGAAPPAAAPPAAPARTRHRNQEPKLGNLSLKMGQKHFIYIYEPAAADPNAQAVLYFSGDWGWRPLQGETSTYLADAG